MKALIFDTETHDKTEPQIIEAAWMSVEFGKPCLILLADCSRFKPSKPITLGAMATHGLMDKDLSGFPDSSTFALPACDYLIGHNVDFDWSAAGSPNDIKRICTLALSPVPFGRKRIATAFRR